MEYHDPHALPHRARRSSNRLNAVWMATAVTTMVLAELIVLDACLAWGAIGLWGLSENGALIFGAAGGLVALWASWRMFMTTYRVEREYLDHDLPRMTERP